MERRDWFSDYARLFAAGKTDGFVRLLPFSRWHSAHLHEWQSLVESLSFACRVICPGRPFLCCLTFATQGVSNALHHAHISTGVRKECARWIHFLSSYNGISLIWPWQLFCPLAFTSLQMLLIGVMPPFFLSWWVQGHWPAEWSVVHINIQEFFPIDLAIQQWFHVWGGSDSYIFWNHGNHASY